MTVGLALFAFLIVILGRFRVLNLLGRELFSCLSWVSMIYALLAGPLTTADCLSAERRQGTLGLLFLTDLHSYDVVLGKMAAASLRIVFDLTALLPVAALPMLMGGVNLEQVASVALGLVNVMFFSLALGTCASALSVSGRSALAGTVGTLFFLSLGVPLLGEMLRVRGAAAIGFWALCPPYCLQWCMAGLLSTRHWEPWLNLGIMHALAWVCLAIAVRRTRNSWRDLPGRPGRMQWNERLERWARGSAPVRQAWRSRMMDRNPVGWLEGRDRLQGRVLWGIILGVALASAIAHALIPKRWPDAGTVVLWTILSHYVLCVWIALQAPRRLADDKHSGALELLLCTPVKTREVVAGCMIILWRRFGRAVLALVALDLFIGACYFSENGGWDKFTSGDFWQLAVCLVAVAPVQAYCLARIGVYEGLAQTTGARATFITAWNAGLLPWICWFGVMWCGELSRRIFGYPRNVTDVFAFSAWVIVQLLVCGLCVGWASWRLHRSFRALAAQTTGTAWWKRLPWMRSGV